MYDTIDEERRTAERLRAGDETLWKEIHDAHFSVIYRVSLATARSREIAHDVAQDVLTHLWRHPERFDPERGTLRSYLITRTRSRTLDVLRSETARFKRERREGRVAFTTGLDVAEAVADIDTAARVREALTSLPDHEREAIELAYFGGRSYRQVAAELDIPEGTAKSRIRSGLSSLRARLTVDGVTV